MNKESLNRLIIFGKGGQGSVVFELASLHNYENILQIDDTSTFQEKKISLNDSIIIAIGDNKTRKEKSILYIENINNFLVHPNAYVSKSTIIGNGSVILANSVLNTSSQICENVIINSSVVIEHHCFIANYVHIAPNSTLCGNVRIEEGAFIGAGSTILPGIKIGEWSIIGAGSVVVKDVEPYQTVYGNPAKIKK